MKYVRALFRGPATPDLQQEKAALREADELSEKLWFHFDLALDFPGRSLAPFVRALVFAIICCRFPLLQINYNYMVIS